jgi:hypothetical protein
MPRAEACDPDARSAASEPRILARLPESSHNEFRSAEDMRTREGATVVETARKQLES